MAALAAALEGLVPVDLIAVVKHEGGAIRVHALHFGSAPRRSDESQEAYVGRFTEATGAMAD